MRFPVVRVALAAALLSALLPAVASADPVGAEQPVAAATVLPAGARTAGPAPEQRSLDLRIVLAPRDPDALTAFVAAVSTPGSSAYGQHLAPGEFADRFGPIPAATEAVRAALAADGIEVQAAPAGTTVLEASATVAQAQAAFGTPIERVRLDDGTDAIANTHVATLPARIADDITAVVGLNTTQQLISHAERGRSARGATRQAPVAAASIPPTICPAGWSAALSIGTVYPAEDMARAYDFTRVRGAGGFGDGITVGLLEYEDYDHTGVQTYQDCYGTSVPITDVDVDGGPGAGLTDPEATLDVEALVGLAPGISLRVYQGPVNSAANWIDVMAKAATEDRASVISSSYGICEPQVSAELAPTTMDAETVVLAQMAAQGQTFVVAAGDDGSSDCVEIDPADQGLAVDDPGSQPYALSVGGTTMTNPGAPPATPPTESTWNDPAPYPSGGGGGISAFHTMPFWQRPFTTAQSSGTPCSAPAGVLCRQVPDVSAVANPDTGYLIYYTGSGNGAPGWQDVGGTSASAPLWAALLSSIQSAAPCADRRFGLVAPALYGLSGSGAFNDVTVGTNVYDNANPGFYPALPGYDMATGLGTPIGGGLLAGLCPSSAPQPTAVTTVTVSTPAPAPEPAPAPTPAAPVATPAAPTVPAALPKVTVAAGPLRLGGANRVGVDLRCPAAGGDCRVSISLRGRGLSAAVRDRLLRAGDAATVPVALSAAEVRRLRAAGVRRVRVRVRVAVQGADGRTAVRTTTRILRIPAR